MFRGTIDRSSHEGGLLVTFNGSSPALGSIIVREEDGHYIGKIDAVLGSTDAPLAHVAHLDRNQDNTSFLGSTVIVRAKKEREERPKRQHRDERPQRREQRSFDRRDNRRERPRQENHGRNDWECPSCGNINFSFRTECNQCGKPKPGHTGSRGQSRGESSGRNRSGRDGDRRGGRDNRRGFGGGRGGRDNRRDSGRGRDSGRESGGSRGRRDDRRDSGRGRDSGRDRQNRGDDKKRPEERYRKARGKRPGHAHNRGPQPIRPRRYQGRNRDD